MNSITETNLLLLHVGFELPLHVLDSIRSESRFINTDYQCTIMKELSQYSTYPHSLFIVCRISILVIRSLELLVFEMKVLLQNLSDVSGWRSSQNTLRKITLDMLLQRFQCDHMDSVMDKVLMKQSQQILIINDGDSILYDIWLLLLYKELCEGLEHLYSSVDLLCFYLELFTKLWRLFSFLILHQYQVFLLILLQFSLVLDLYPRIIHISILI